MTASVYFRPTDGQTILDVGRNSKIAEIDLRTLKPLADQSVQLQAKRLLFEILRDSQFKNMAESGALRMASASATWSRK